MKHLAASTALGLCLLINGCTGDERPFLEAVEVQRLGIRSVEIRLPEGSPDAFSVGVGESVALGLVARGSSADDEIELDSDDRDWRSADTSRLTVSDSGVVTGIADGRTEIDVRVGGVVSRRLTVDVSSGELQSIESIVGPDTLEACIPGRYVAIGAFEGGTTRLLGDVDWSFGENGSRREPDADDLAAGAIRLVPDGIGDTSLSARFGTVETSRTLAVLDTLDSLSLPTGLQTLREDDTLQLTASATYGSDDGSMRRVQVTDGVEWSVSSGDAVSISNESPTRGLVRGERTGDAIVQAQCGAEVATARIGVNTSGPDDDSGLSFDRSGPVPLVVGSVGVQLRVSTGSDFEDDREVTTEADVTFESDAVGVASVDNGGQTPGFVRPVAAGSANIRVIRDGATASIQITVQ